MTAAVEPRNASSATAAAAAAAVKATFAVPVDPAACSTAAASGGATSSPVLQARPSNPAVQVLSVKFAQVSTSSVNYYRWGVKHSVKSEKSSVKWSEKTSVNMEVQV